MLHEHPVKIMKYALKNIWLLIFPLLRGIKTYHLNIDVFYNWIKGSWFDILIILLIIGFGFLRWSNTWIKFGSSKVIVLTGIFLKNETTIPYSNFSVIMSERPVYLKPFNVVKIRIKTKGAALKKADLNLLIRTKDAKDLRRRTRTVHKEQANEFILQPNILTIIFFSFLFSNSISGTAYISTIFFQLGRVTEGLLQNELKNVITHLTSEVSSVLTFGIPPAAITVGILIIATWIWSFAANIIRYAGFSMKKDRDYIEVRMGAVVRRRYNILNDKVNYIDIRQNIIMKIFRKASLNINCSGYGHKKNELPVLLPILNRSQSERVLELLDFGIDTTNRQYKAKRAAVLTYLGLPLCFCIGIPVLSIYMRHLLSGYAQYVIPFAVMAEIPSVWMLVVKIIALLTTGVSIDDRFICIKYARFFTFHTVIVDRKNLVKTQIVQNPLQKMMKRCRLDFFFNSEKPMINKLHGMNICESEDIVRILNK